MIKKLFIFIAVLSLFSIGVSAEENIHLKPHGEFYIYGEQNQKITEILGSDTKEIDEFCEQNAIEFLAVNENNTKQIRLSCYSDDFSSSIININGLSDDKIIELLPDITGFENVKGEIINKNGQKFVKIQLKSSDSGGEFLTAQYFTVAGRKNYVLSFYTHVDEKTDYIDKTFETFDCKEFDVSNPPTNNFIRYTVLISIFIFFAVSVLIIFTIIKDIRKKEE